MGDAANETLRSPIGSGRVIAPRRQSDPNTPTVRQDRRATSGAAASLALVLGRLGQKWEIGGCLGIGGSARVFEAVHRNGRRGALKVLRRELVDEPDARARFLREGVIANRVHHPGIVDALDDDELPDGTPVLVMELLEGQPLDAMIDAAPGSRLEPSEVARIGVKLLEVVAAVHEAGVVHRDIKPENVFITQDGTLKLLDFGISHFDDGHRESDAYPGVPMGTPGYMPAEQARGEWDHVDARSDLWAVGAVLFRMLTGSFVQEGATQLDQLRAAMYDPPTLVADRLPDAPRGLAAVIDKALELERSTRWQTAEQMRRALAAALTVLEPTKTIVQVASLETSERVEDYASAVAEVVHQTVRAPRWRMAVASLAFAAVGMCAQQVQARWAVPDHDIAEDVPLAADPPSMPVTLGILSSLPAVEGTQSEAAPPEEQLEPQASSHAPVSSRAPASRAARGLDDIYRRRI